MKPFVYIIESPSSDDLLDGRTEGRVLNEALDLADIPMWYSLVTNRKTLHDALGERLTAAINYWNGQKAPILHLSMHGDQNGIALTNDDFIEWHELRRMLLPLTRAMQGGLLICMSTCFGSAGIRMAMYEDNEPPFWALIGNMKTAAWSDAAVAYITFYHLFFKGVPIERSVEAMRLASGDNNFSLQLGHKTKMEWIQYIQQIHNLNQRLQQAAVQNQRW